MGATTEPIITKGGITVAPEITVDEIIVDPSTVLLLPGADVWDNLKYMPIIEKATELLKCGGTVGAICGATTALAEAGLLDERIHTSNSLEYLKMVCPNYNGELYYRDVKAIADGNLITANSAGGLLSLELYSQS